MIDDDDSSFWNINYLQIFESISQIRLRTLT